jgi:RNA polymerase sigma-70 factor, ECF subfamily
MIQPNSDFIASSSPSESETASSTPESQSVLPAAPSEKAELIELVRRADAGESSAQSELMRRYSRRIAGFVRAIIRQPDAIEDVTQMVFIKMFRRLGRLRDFALFESWLFTLARNTCLDFIRRRNCRPTTVTIDEEVNQIADPSHSDASAEILAALDRAVARLSPVDRTLVTQFVAGESYGSIAEQSGLTLATVKVRLHRVRPFLRMSVGEMTETRQRGGKGWHRTSGSRAASSWPGSTALQSAPQAA